MQVHIHGFYSLVVSCPWRVSRSHYADTLSVSNRLFTDTTLCEELLSTGTLYNFEKSDAGTDSNRATSRGAYVWSYRKASRQSEVVISLD